MYENESNGRRVRLVLVRNAAVNRNAAALQMQVFFIYILTIPTGLDKSNLNVYGWLVYWIVELPGSTGLSV